MTDIGHETILYMDGGRSRLGNVEFFAWIYGRQHL